MALQTRYITVDEFFEYTGINLREELNDTNNPSDKAEAFLVRIEDRMEAFLNAHFFKLITDEWPYWNDLNKGYYKKALIEQALYVFKNGDISVDSGYDPEKGMVASKPALTEITIAPNAKNYLMLCGMWTAHIRGGCFFPWAV